MAKILFQPQKGNMVLYGPPFFCKNMCFWNFSNRQGNDPKIDFYISSEHPGHYKTQW